MMDLPGRTRIVIVGGGIVGCSIAYHLALRGVSDVVLLERQQLTSGTTWHAAGLVGQLRATQNLTQLAQYTTQLFATLEADTGQATGFQQRGSVSVAANLERFEELKRQASMARVFGLEVEVITPSEVVQLVKNVRVDDLVGAVYLPGDGVTNPVDTTRALAAGARARGVTIRENTKVERILVKDGHAIGVAYSLNGETHKIHADVVVNAAGMWGRELGAQVGVSVPLHAAEHFYVVTEAIDGISPTMPVLRDQDNFSYFKEDAGKLLVGFFEPVAKPWGMPQSGGASGIPDSFCFDSLPADYDHIAPLIEAATDRMPLLADAGIRLFFNGPESFTPDDRYLLGESAELKNLFMACGFNSIGIQSSGGAGKVLADWIIDGYPPMDLWDVDVRRVMPFQGNANYLRERTVETLGLLYSMHWPYRQPATARGVRRSVLHDRLSERGACFGEMAGWERANWFAPDGTEPAYEYSYGRQNWFPYSRAEHLGVREGVGIFDLSSFGKYLVQGVDAEAVLNQVCANDVAVPIGKIVYTQWLNERGTIEADLTVTREAEDRYLVVTAAATQVRDLAWLREHIPDSSRCTVTDVTSAMSVLSIMGPKSRALLTGLMNENLSNESFPFGTSRIVDLAYARVRASRITYVGELGWELYIPTEFAAGVFDEIEKAGHDFDLQLCGYHALNSLRMEKGYRHWGHDISPDDNPIEAGLGFAVAWDKPGGFIGREALIQERESGPKRRLAQFRLTDNEKLLYHNEPIWRNDVMVGRITSGMYGHSVDAPLGMGYVENAVGLADRNFILTGEYEIEVACERVPAVVSLAPFYDPKSERVKS
ncbi:MAG TPA: FAD-dependent oxidoreductase [Candidatus Nanopelagicaceae bacterium]|nr:FAD-dependent oxidoreductase [Candidatus Nanopelagicaceae bacterium]